MVRGDEALHKLFTVMAQRYADREGGYTRVLRSRRRTNDAAQMAYIECAALPRLLADALPHRLHIVSKEALTGKLAPCHARKQEPAA